MTVHFGPDDWQRIARDYTAWWDGRLDRPKDTTRNSIRMSKKFQEA